MDEVAEEGRILALVIVKNLGREFAEDDPHREKGGQVPAVRERRIVLYVKGSHWRLERSE